MPKFKILIISSLFPNKLEATRGIFTKNTLDCLNNYCEFDVIVPIPWFPRFKIMRELYKSNYKRHFGIDFDPDQAILEHNNGYRVFYPKYFSIPVIGFPLLGFFYFLSIIKLVKRNNYKAVLGFWLYPDSFAAALISRCLRLPLITVGLGSDVNVLTGIALLRPAIRYVLKQSGKIILVSHALESVLLKLKLAKKNKIAVITNGANLDTFKPMDKAECRRNLGLPSDRKIILFAGNLIETKGIHILINAYISLCLSKPHNKVLLVVIGEGKLRASLEKKVTHCMQEGYVNFLGWQPYESMPLWMNAADLFCLPSLNEGCPNVLLEAKACGIPLVASNVGEVPRIVTADAGIVVVPGSAEELRQAIEKVLSKSWGTYSLMKRTWGEAAHEYFAEIDKAVAAGVCE